jgi:hypothetical protein
MDVDEATDSDEGSSGAPRIPGEFEINDEEQEHQAHDLAAEYNTVYDHDRIIDDARGLVTDRSVLLVSNDSRTELQIAVDALVQEPDPMDVGPERFANLHTETKDDIIVVPQFDTLPANEFDKNNMLASMCFPTLFPYGTHLSHYHYSQKIRIGDGQGDPTYEGPKRLSPVSDAMGFKHLQRWPEIHRTWDELTAQDQVTTRFVNRDEKGRVTERTTYLYMLYFPRRKLHLPIRIASLFSILGAE